MDPIRNFEQLTSHLQTVSERKRVAVVCGTDDHTQYAINRAHKEGFAEFIMVGEGLSTDDASREGVRLVRQGEADVLMKGIVNTDNLLRAILDKEQGLLPRGRVLTHLSVMKIPSYDKLLFFSDAAVIPSPTLEQKMAMIRYAIRSCECFGIEKPRIALIHCTEKVNPKFPHSVDYAKIVEMTREGEFGDAIIDGPMDVKTACESESGNIKGIHSPIGGEADVLIFPNIEAGNVFYKAVTCFAHADMAGVLQGTTCPVVLPSRSDSGLSKYYSLATACLTA